MTNEYRQQKELKFTDNLKQCISNGNTKAKYVEIFLINGIGLNGHITYASESLVVIGNNKSGYSNVNPAHIGSYMIEPPKRRVNNFNR